MPEQDDLFVARHALRDNDITREQLQEALLTMVSDWGRARPIRSLGTILVEKGYLSQSRLNEILCSTARMMVPALAPSEEKERLEELPPAPATIPVEASRGDSIKLGQLLAMAGIVTYSQVMEALLAQEESREEGQPRMRIGEYLVSMGYTTAQAIQRALSYQSKTVYSCRACDVHYNVVNAKVKRVYQCSRCQGELLPSSDAIKVDGSMSIEPLPTSVSLAPPPPLAVEAGSFPMFRLQADRALALHLKQYQLAPERPIRDAEYWQVELGQFGIYVPLLDILMRLGTLSEGVAQKLRGVDFPAATEHKLEIPGYHILDRITCGLMTSVFYGQSHFTPTPVGLKLVHPDLSRNEALVARFQYDASLLMRFDHPGLVKGYECGFAPLAGSDGLGLHYAILEYVRGATLDHVVRVRGKLPPQLALSVTKDLAEALTYLQQEGFLATDLRAESVLIDDRRRARILDLGSATPYDRSAKTDPRIASEIFALGALLQGMLSGTPTAAPRNGPPPRENLSQVEMPKGLRDALDVLLNPDAGNRFHYIADVLDVLESAGK